MVLSTRNPYFHTILINLDIGSFYRFLLEFFRNNSIKDSFMEH